MLTLSFFSKLVTINGNWSGEFVLPVGIASEHKQKAVVCKLDIKFSGLGCSKHDQYRPGEIIPKQNSACYFKALSNSLVMKIKGLPVIVKTFKHQILLPYQTVPL